MLPESKICSMCKIDKPKSDYHVKKEKGGKYVYLKSRCKICSAKANLVSSSQVTCECGAKMDKRSKTCRKCIADKTVTLGDCHERYEKHHSSSRGALVRDRARKRYRTDESSCQRCGYSYHVEVCHIKPVHSFDLSTLIDDINSPDNILLLCPNCHWEFDNGRLTIDQIGHLGNAPSLSL